MVRRHTNLSRTLQLIYWLACLPIGVAFSQKPPLPGAADIPVATASPSPSPASTRPQLNIPDIPSAVEPPTLVPELSGNTSAVQKAISRAKTPPLSELDAAFRQSPLAQAAEEQRLHLEWRELQNRTVQDPEVAAAKKAAMKAKTDLEKRTLLRDYYNIFYARMQARASGPAMKKYLEQKKAAAIAGIAQPRVRPDPTPMTSRKR